MITEINLRDKIAGIEYCLSCDLEKGELIEWRVIPIDPLPLQMALNIPFLSRPAASVMSPCAQKAAASAEVQAGSVRKSIRLGPDGKPIERM